MRKTMLTRRRFAMLAGTAAASAILGALPGCAASGKPDDAASEGPADSLREEPPTLPREAAAEAAESPATVAAIPSGALCVAEYAGNTLAVVDPATGEVSQRIATGSNPATALAADGWIYVGSSGGGQITALSATDPSQVKAISVGNQPLGLCYDGGRGLLYVGDYFASSVHVVDSQLKSLVGTIKLNTYGYHNRTDPPDCCRIEPGAGRRTVALALAPEGDILYCANYGTFDVGRIDLAAEAEVEAFDGVVGPRQILVTPDGAQLVLAGVGGEGEQQVSDLYVLDRATGKRAREVFVGQSVAGAALSPAGDAAWAIARDDGELVAFKGATWEEAGRLFLSPGIDTLLASPDGATLFVANSATGEVFVVDAAALTVTATVTGLASPKGMAVVA